MNHLRMSNDDDEINVAYAQCRWFMLTNFKRKLAGCQRQLTHGKSQRTISGNFRPL